MRGRGRKMRGRGGGKGESMEGGEERGEEGKNGRDRIMKGRRHACMCISYLQGICYRLVRS